MANNIRIGSDTPDIIMFDTFDMPIANQSIILSKLIPKTNSWVDNDIGVWEINDSWDVEFINSRTIKINKFKIDTWGIRHKITVNSIAEKYYDYENMLVKVEGLDYVHKNIIKANANSDEVTGFVPAYFGTNGWLPTWRPGQFTSGKYIQGLVMQGCGDYTEASNKYGDVSFAVGRDVNSIVDIREHFVTDGLRPKGAPHGNFPRGFCIGLFGGVQDAETVYDETRGAYKEYDISEHPIYIYLDVPDITGDIDVSSVECWDANLGSSNIYHKDKTIENCWKEYGMVTEESNCYKLDFASAAEVGGYILPEVIDYEEHILPQNNSNIKFIKWAHNIANSEFWENIKEFLLYNPIIKVENIDNPNNSIYTTDDTNTKAISNEMFRGAGITGPLTVKFDGNFNFLDAPYWIRGNNIDILTLQFLQDNISISSLLRFFSYTTIKNIKVIDSLGRDSNKFLSAFDMSAMCEGSTVPSNFPAIFNWNVRANIDGVKCTSIAYMFSNSKGLLSFASSTVERDSDNNSIVINNCQQAFENCTSLNSIYPVLYFGYTNLSRINNDYNQNGYRMFYKCNALSDVYIKNLNGSYVNFADDTEMGNIPNLSAESIQYLFNNLTDLTNYNENIINNDINHNFAKIATSNSDVDVTISTLTFKKYKKSTSTDISITLQGKDLDTTIYTHNIEGKYIVDIVYPNGNIQNQLEADGDYDLFGDTIPAGVGQREVCLRLRSLTSDTDGDITENYPTIEVRDAYNPSAPKAPSAELHCPATWEDKITAEMISNANAKKWSVIIEN